MSIEFEKEIMSIFKTVLPRVVISGDCIRNHYFNLESDTVDLFVKKLDVQNFTDWLDYRLPELLNFSSSIYYLQNMSRIRRPARYALSVEDSVERFRKMPPSKGGKITYRTTINYSNKKIRINYLDCYPERYIIYGSELNLDKCFFNGKDLVYNTAFKADVKNKEITISKNAKGISEEAYCDSVALYHILDGKFKLSDLLIEKANELAISQNQYMGDSQLAALKYPKLFSQEFINGLDHPPTHLTEGYGATLTTATISTSELDVFSNPPEEAEEDDN